MSYRDLAYLFEERVENIDFYENIEVMKTTQQLKDTLAHHSKQILFLIGEPGVGKSVFLRQLDRLLEYRYELLVFDTPFLEPVDFIKMLIKKGGREPADFSLEQLLKEAKELYEKRDAIVVVDEAQLLTKEMIELIRILADSKSFWFLLAMHKHESKKILSEPQFASRPHKIFELGAMSKAESSRFIINTLTKVNETEIANRLGKRYLSLIYRFTKGNFRELKKLLFHLFLIMDEAARLGERRFERVDKCTLTMAAIESGLVDA